MADEQDGEKKKATTYKEAIEQLTELIGTQAPIQEADALRKSLSTVGNQDAAIPPEIQETLDDLKKRSEAAKQ